MIELRLDEVSALRGKYELLAKNEVASDIKSIACLLRPGDNSMCRSQERDFSDAERPDVINWLQNLGFHQRYVVKVYWVPDREGIQVGYEDFVLNFDELWYPSRDDVWVTSDERTWLIELDHEEIFSFYVLDPQKNNQNSGDVPGAALR